MIEVQHLTKRYGRVTAVDDVSFTVERGEILGFLGPNGAGKTTTMRVLTGYMPATEGKAIVAGFDVFEQPIEAKRRTGYLPETPPLYPDMTVSEYLTFVSKIACLRRIAGRASKRAMDRTQSPTWPTASAPGYPRDTGSASGLSSTHPQPRRPDSGRTTAGLDPKQIIETRQLITGAGAITPSS